MSIFWVELAEQRPFTAEDHTLLTVLAGRLGQGLQRVYEVDEQRETAVALQHAMLGPASLPGGFAVRYHPASRPLQVGGDWYDVVNIDAGRVALIVGDCVGHGLAAATVMGQLRSACRALLLEKSSPSAVLAGLDRFAARLPGAHCTTAFCAVLTLATGEAGVLERRASTGHHRAGRWHHRDAGERTGISPGDSAGADPARSPRHDAAALDAAALHRRLGRTSR